jgi:hypothetical protein
MTGKGRIVVIEINRTLESRANPRAGSAGIGTGYAELQVKPFFAKAPASPEASDASPAKRVSAKQDGGPRPTMMSTMSTP